VCAYIVSITHRWTTLLHRKRGTAASGQFYAAHGVHPLPGVAQVGLGDVGQAVDVAHFAEGQVALAGDGGPAFVHHQGGRGH
jgi:hypothetical protein